MKKYKFTFTDSTGESITNVVELTPEQKDGFTIACMIVNFDTKHHMKCELSEGDEK